MAALSGKNAALAIAADKRATAAGLANQKRLESAKLKTNSAIAAADAKLAKTQESINARRHSQTMRQLREEARAWDKKTAALKKDQAKQARESARFRKGVGGIAGSTLGTLGGLARSGITAAGLGGSVLLAASVSKQLDVQKEAADLANQAAANNDPRDRKTIQASVLGQAGELSQKTGMERSQIIAGLRSFVEISGDLKGAQESISGLADIADASGAELSDVAQAAGIFSHQLAANGLKGKELNEALDKVMRSGVGLSAAGSVEFKDVAKIAGKIQAASGRAGGDPAQAIIDAMALTQLAVFGGASGGEEAGVSVQRLTDDIMKHWKGVNKTLGKDAFDKKGGLKMGLREIVLGLVDKTGGDPRKLMGIFNQRSMKSVEYLAKVKRGENIKDLSPEQLTAKKAFLTGEVSKELIAEGAKFKQEQADRQLTKAFESLYAAVGTEMVPILVNDFIPALKDATPSIVTATRALAGFIEWVSANKGEAAAVLVAGAIGRSILDAQLGQIVAGQMGSAISTSILTAGIGAIVAAAIIVAIEHRDRDKANDAAQNDILKGDLPGELSEADKLTKIGPKPGSALDKFQAATTLVGGALGLTSGLDERNRAGEDTQRILRRAKEDYEKTYTPKPWQAGHNDLSPGTTPTAPPDQKAAYDRIVKALNDFADAANAARSRFGDANKPPAGRGNDGPNIARKVGG
jgi:hypothetical protein